MQPAPAISPWPKRILLLGCAMALIGFILYIGQAETIGEYFDPRETSEHQVEFGTPETFNFEAGCWVVNVEGDGSAYEVEYALMENGTASGLAEEGCRADFEAQTVDVQFSELTTLDLAEDSTIKVTITCTEVDACENPIYFTNSYPTVFSLFQNPSIIITGFMCCMGIFMIPFGWMLMMMTKGKAAQVQLQQQQMVTAMEPIDEIAGGQQQMEMLTTEQVYQMIRGEMPEMNPQENEVPSPFANVDTRPRKNIEIKSKGGSINTPSGYTHENPPKDDSWKNWDEA